jgi:hypothetical protein
METLTLTLKLTVSYNLMYDNSHINNHINSKLKFPLRKRMVKFTVTVNYNYIGSNSKLHLM